MDKYLKSMKCLIKNIPPPTFGIAGNRGIGFPVVDQCSVEILPPADFNCYLVKDQDITTNITTENDSNIIVACTNPEEV